MARACGNLFPAPGKRKDSPVSQRTPAKARIRRSRTVTSRSTDRQRDNRRWLSSEKAVKSPGLLQDAKSAAWPIRRGCFACRRFYRTESAPVTKNSRQDPASGLPKSKSWSVAQVGNREIYPDLIHYMTRLCRIPWWVTLCEFSTTQRGLAPSPVHSLGSRTIGAGWASSARQRNCPRSITVWQSLQAGPANFLGNESRHRRVIE